MTAGRTQAFGEQLLSLRNPRHLAPWVGVHLGALPTRCNPRACASGRVGAGAGGGWLFSELERPQGGWGHRVGTPTPPVRFGGLVSSRMLGSGGWGRGFPWGWTAGTRVGGEREQLQSQALRAPTRPRKEVVPGQQLACLRGPGGAGKGRICEGKGRSWEAPRGSGAAGG